MKRHGYKKGYDKNSVHQEDPATVKRTEREKKYAKKKKKLRMNTIEFVIGLILLIFCRQYLQQHPAEKVALVTGFEVIIERVQTFFSTEDKEAFEAKHSLERTYAEVISLASQSSCLSSEKLLQLKQRFEAMKKLDIATFEQQKNAFATYLQNVYLFVEKNCASTGGADAI